MSQTIAMDEFDVAELIETLNAWEWLPKTTAEAQARMYEDAEELGAWHQEGGY